MYKNIFSSKCPNMNEVSVEFTLIYVLSASNLNVKSLT